MKVGIVGAGIAGLAAARTLKAAGSEVTIYEKQREPGGRCATVRLGEYVFDSGATSIAPRGKLLERAMLNELPGDDLVKIKKPIYMHAFGRVSPSPASKLDVARYTYSQGNSKLPQLLSENLDVRYEAEIDFLERSDGRFVLRGEQFDALILTPPIPQTADLLQTLGEYRSFANSRYRPCLSVLMGFNTDLGERSYHALVDPEQRHPLTWLSIETEKAPNRAPEGHTAMVAQLSPVYSAEQENASEQQIVEETLTFIARLYGEKLGNPATSAVVRWSYSQPETTALFSSVNRPGSKLLVASDGVIGGRVEQAYEVGVQTAERLLAGGA